MSGSSVNGGRHLLDKLPEFQVPEGFGNDFSRVQWLYSFLGEVIRRGWLYSFLGEVIRRGWLDSFLGEVIRRGFGPRSVRFIPLDRQ
jgi:hypothetical protein